MVGIIQRANVVWIMYIMWILFLKARKSVRHFEKKGIDSIFRIEIWQPFLFTKINVYIQMHKSTENISFGKGYIWIWTAVNIFQFELGRNFQLHSKSWSFDFEMGKFYFKMGKKSDSPWSEFDYNFHTYFWDNYWTWELIGRAEATVVSTF